MFKKTDKPIYLHIYNAILNDIKNKKYQPLKAIPSENSLSKMYDANRHTIRKALKILKNEGHIYTKRGLGNFIASINIPYSITDKSSYSSKIADLGYTPKTKLLHVDIVEANKQIAKKLNLSTKTKVIKLKLLRFADDLPIQVTYNYFDAFRYKKILDYLDFKPFSLYKILEQCYPYLEIRKISTQFESSLSSKEFSKDLDIAKNTPILSVHTISKDQNNNYVEYGISNFRGDICKINVDLTGDN